jgi:ribose transport system permease protein
MFRFAAHQKTALIAGFLVVLTLVCWLLKPAFLKADSVDLVLKYAGLFGIIALGVSFVIITGGIDLSIGSWIGFSAVLLPVLVKGHGCSPLAAVAVIIGLSAAAGAAHGLLVTKLRLQPFLITLCGLFIYRGFARVAGGGREQMLPDNLKWMTDTLVSGRPFAALPIPAVFIILLLLGLLAALFLNKTVWGRHMLATGRSEQAARFSGINTDAVRITAFVICSVLAGVAGILWLAESKSALGSSFGSFYELWAIAGAVLGGCSLRGGECAIAAVLLGSVMVAEIKQGVLFVVEDLWKEVVLGLFVLGGVILDELMSRWLVRRG